MKFKLTLIYCALCRYFFELSTPVAAYFFVSLKWAILISIVFVLWQILGFTLVKHSQKPEGWK